MNEHHRLTVQRFWATANARDWPAFGALLHPELVYLVPQTRERVRTREGLVDLFSTWPGDWTAQVQTLVADRDRAVSTIEFLVDAEAMTGISFFDFEGGLIRRVTDYWPSPYEPPARLSRWIERT
jgi:ketosteroid isomerase-like protein